LESFVRTLFVIQRYAKLARRKPYFFSSGRTGEPAGLVKEGGGPIYWVTCWKQIKKIKIVIKIAIQKNSRKYLLIDVI
jgi:hypothetical protein